MAIYEVPNERRYWVVRAEGGFYFDHFTKHGVIALGHINILDLPNSKEEDAPLEWKNLQNVFKAKLDNAPEIKRGGLHLSQVKSFLYEMKVGDWVMTVRSGAVCFGRIIGKPFIEKEPLLIVYDPEHGPKIEMDMHLRRCVEWGPTIARRDLPYGLLLSLKANQTVFNVDAKWDAIYHTLYPAFRKENKLFLSAKITTEQAIKNHNVSTIFKLLDEVEIIGKEIACGANSGNFEQLISKYIETDALTITTKAQFHSPGEIWNAITGVAGNLNLDHWATYTTQ